ncbi:MAG: gliding motility-associated C-terminal domain-containing protein [Bacteroidota bacterium]|nr:gliding motility-associated C-terminal domain-containing protein [Bacteroidota bacterium]
MRTRLLLSVVISLLSSGSAFAQLSPSQWENAKKNGELNGKAKAAPVPDQKAPPMQYKLAPNTPVKPASNSCQCWQTRDSSWSIVPMSFSTPPDYRNDDDSSPLINLPFTFCLYGTTWTDCYINNNGNVSFGAPYGTFTASGFPNASFVMVAPFWSDVDTRNVLSGLPYYKITPTYMVVQWDAVGYYASYADKVNTFQLIITNGSDPIVPGGNVSFCYKDMQWTTGDASNGVGGFGGSDAIVGANQGNGVDYIQFGAFNQPGGVYNGPAVGGSGIDWLDFQTFLFDACGSSNNVPPTASGIAVCDTVYLCIGDTLPLNVSFFSPEPAQNTVVTIDTTGTTGYVQLTNTPGNTATLAAYFIGSASNAGTNTVTITATDNGTPAGITSIPIVIVVLPAPNIVASNDTSICAGDPVNLFATGGITYTWSPATNLSDPNISNPVATPATTTTYVVTATNGTCSDSEPVVVTVQFTLANAGPDTTICLGGNAFLTATGGTSYSWSPTTGLNNPAIQNPIATPTITTTYTCTVTNAIGCTDVDIATITITSSPVAIFSFTPTVIFADSSYYFLDQSTGGATSWSWDFGDGNTSTSQNPSHLYSAGGTYQVCLTTTNNAGCTNTVCSDVIVLPRDVVGPNVFTPNGDGTNDVLIFQNLSYYPNTAIYIYDRWGILVYENGNYLNDWNGKKNGSGAECVDGTYYYVLSGINLKETVTGFVQLIRGK